MKLPSIHTSLIPYKYPLFCFVLWTMICFTILPSVRGQHPPVDSSGWSVINPSADSRIMYVSVTGNDTTGQIYSTAQVGANPRNPTITVNAFRTISAARANVRNGFPDWVLLRRGETWGEDVTLQLNQTSKDGRSPTERVVITWYGTSGNRPVLTGAFNSLGNNGPLQNNAFIGIEFYDHLADPLSPTFSSPQKCRAVNFLEGGNNILIEDCGFRYRELGFQAVDGPYSNVTLRRNIFADTYYNTSCADQAARLSGAYLSGIVNLLVEENLNDHSGWSELVAGAGKNAYDHGYYGQYTNSGSVIYRGNITSRPSGNGCQWRSGAIAEMNLHIQDSAGLYVAADASHGAIVDAFGVRDNVCVEGMWMGPCPQSSGAQWGIPIGNLPAGSPIHNNIVAHRFDPAITNGLMGIQIRTGLDYQGNIVHDFKDSEQTPNPGWLDPNRTVGGYYASIGGTNSTVDFLNALRQRAVGTWPTNMSAYAVINYIRAGFNKGPVAPAYSGQPGPVATISVSDAAAGEPADNGQFTVTLSPAPAAAVTVNLTRTGTATNGTDYVSIPTTVSVPTSGSATIPVTVINDSAVESVETVILTLASGSGYTIGSSNSGTVNITSDDSGTPVVTIAATDASAGEPSDSGQFTVSASPLPTAPITVNLSRTGTATNGVDYTSIPTTVTVPTSGTTTIPVTVTNDSTVEGIETVTLTVASGTGYTVGTPNSGTVNIADDDTSSGPAVANSGFETPTTVGHIYNPTGGSWIFNSKSGIQRNGSAWGAPNAPQGVQTAFLQGAGTFGNIVQTINFVSAGTYRLTFQAARRAGQIQPLRVRIDGTQVGSLLTPASNAFALLTSSDFTVTVGNHTVMLEATDSSGDKSTFVDDVAIATVASSLSYKINFQTATATVPAGYVADTGGTYAARNGLTYGWNSDVSAAARERNIDPDKRKDTLIHIFDTSTIWEMAVPNGTYTYTLVCGDPQYTDGINNMQIESTILLDPDGKDNFDTFTGTVVVSDGKVTIKRSNGGVTSRVCYLDLQ